MKSYLSLVLLTLTILCFPKINFGQTPDLGVTSSFALFTGAGAFNNLGITTVTGDIGTNAGAFSGFPPGVVIGQIHVADAVAAQAASDVNIAYSQLAGLTCGSVIGTTLGNGQVLTPNIYCTGAATTLNGNLTLDGQGDPNAIFIFQIDGALATSTFSNVFLINGANLCNVYWQVNGAFALGDNSVFRGTVVAGGAITLQIGSTLFGRALTTAGAISTSANNVSNVPCACELSVTCPPASGGNFQCISDIPAGLASDITINSFCVSATVAISETSTGTGCPGSPYVLTRTYTVTDEAAHSTACEVTYTAVDNTAPTVICPAPLTVQCSNQVPAASPASVLSSDNCSATSVVFVGQTISNQTCVNRYTLTQTYRATDLCGNSATCAQIITVFDNTAPQLSTPPADATVQCTGIPTPAILTATDNCIGTANVVFSSTTIPGLCANDFSLVRVWTATDACGNSSSVSQTITVVDNTAPNITCPAPVTVQCQALVPQVNIGNVISSDNCGGAVTVKLLNDAISNQTCANRFTLTRTYQAVDPCGNLATCSQLINVFDNTLPILSPAPANIAVQCNAIPPPATITATDNCGGGVNVVFSTNTTPDGCLGSSSIQRIWTATDLCGNSASVMQIITVIDNTPPSIVCPPPVTVQCLSQVPPVNLGSVMSADNCGGATLIELTGNVVSNQLCTNRFTLTRTYGASDQCGNAAFCNQIITVFDNTAPLFSNPPPNVTVNCFAVPGILAPPTALDNCNGVATVVFLDEIQTPGICPVLYTLVRRWSASDECGNSSIVSQQITVIDNLAPQFANVQMNVVVECDPATNMITYQNWLDNHGGAVVTDCSAVTWSFINSPFIVDPASCAGTFKQYIRFIATDACGNSSYRDAKFIVMDMTPPVFTVMPQNLNLEANEECYGDVQLSEWVEHFGYAEVSDNCGSVTTEIALLYEKKGCGNTFSRTYQFRATDECGNTNFVNATFTLVDNMPPVIISCPPGNALLTCEYDIPAPDTSSVIATDNCGPVIVSVQNIYSYGTGCEFFPLSKSYTYSVSDLCGNVVTCVQSFQVVDSIPPIYTGPDTLFVNCVSDLPGTGEITAILAPYMVDNCYDVICFARSSTAQDGVNSITFLVKAKDLCGNWTQKFMVTFVATGACKPLCSTTQTIWGDPNGTIGSMTTTEALDKFMDQYGGVTAGKFNKTASVTSTNCLQNLLPGFGNTQQFSPGNYEFGASNECNPVSPLQNNDGSLNNVLAANAMAMQLNIWYNQQYNGRDLGIQRLQLLPECMVDPLVIQKMEAAEPSVQNVLDLSNEYLAGVTFYDPGFGNLLNNALENLNIYWLNCDAKSPCTGAQQRDQLPVDYSLSNLSLEPNPVIDIATINFDISAATELHIRIIGISGVQSELLVQAHTGANTLSFATHSFPVGVYTIVLQDASKLQTLRMVKMEN